MFHRHAIFIALGIALAGGPAAAQNVDALIAARAGDAALKACLDRSAYVRSYREHAAWAAGAARDPNAPAKFNCGIGGSAQEVAPKACCVAYERDKAKKAAWQDLQMCGWRDLLPRYRKIYEEAASRCLAQTAAKPPTPPQQQAQKPQTAVPSPQQQAQRPQPTPPSAPSHEAQRAPTRPTPAWPEPGWPTPAPAYPPYSGPTQQGQVPLTPPPPIPVSPSGTTQQAQVPLTPPPPIPPLGPAQQKPMPTGDPVALKALVNHMQMTAVDAWKVRPPLKDELKSLKIPGLLVFKDAGGGIKCAEKGGPGPIDYFRKPHKLRYRLIDNRDIVIRVITNFGYSFAEADAIANALKLDESKIPPEIRDRSYALWDGMDLYHFLYGTMLLFGTREPAALKLPAAWDPLCPEQKLYSSEHSSIRGTINGGGDFINYAPNARPSDHPLLHRIGGIVRTRPLAPRGYASAAAEATTIRVPGGSVRVPEAALAAIDVAPNGITAVAVLFGTVLVRETETKAAREVEQDSVAVIIPKKGVSRAVPLPTETRKKLVEMRQGAEAGRQIAQGPLGPRVSEATPARGVKDGKPVEPGAVFKSDTKELFVWFRLSGVTAPTQIRSVWNYVAPDGDQFIVQSEATARPENQWGNFRVEGPAGRPWPTGQYRVDIFISGKKAASVPFRVEDVVAHPAIVAARAALGVKDGEPVGVSEVFAPDAGTLYAWFRIAGHTQPVKLRGEWHYLGSGGDRMVIASDLTVQPNESWGDFQFELPPGRPWPLGAYRVDILMDGKLAASVPFRIEQPGAAPAPQALAAPKIVEAKAAHGVKEGGIPVGVTEVFAPDAGRLYVWFRIAGHDRPVKLLSEWHYLGTGRDELLADIEMTGQPGKDGGHFAFELLPGRLWPLGAYRVDILLDGKVAASVPFHVATAAPKPAARPQVKVFDMLVARGIKDGKPVAPAAAFAPDASPLYVWFRVSGNTEPVKLRGEWRYLGGGQDRIIARGEGMLKAGSAWTNFRRTLAEGKTWALGDYRFDLFVDDTLASSARFRIVEGGPKLMVEAAASPKIVEAKPARDVNEDGKPVGPSDVFTPDTRQIFIWYRITGNPAPVEMHSVWRYLGGGGDSASAPEGGTQPAGREWGAFGKEREANDPWPVGEYRVDIFIGGAQAASVPFRVAAATPVAGSAGPVTFETVEALLNELGAKPRRDTRPDGVPFLAFRLDGRDMALALFGCAPGKPCVRLMLHTGFRLPQPVPAETLNAWTAEHRFVRAFHDDEGDPMLESDLVAVGSRMSTVREWIAEWRKQVPQFLDRVAKKG
jgi:hypothetical protein